MWVWIVKWVYADEISNMNKDLFEKSYFQLNLLGQLLTNETYAFDWLFMCLLVTNHIADFHSDAKASQNLVSGIKVKSFSRGNIFRCFFVFSDFGSLEKFFGVVLLNQLKKLPRGSFHKMWTLRCRSWRTRRKWRQWRFWGDAVESTAGPRLFFFFFF